MSEVTDVKNNVSGSSVNLSSYTGSSYYVFPYDGYVNYSTSDSQGSIVLFDIYDANGNSLFQVKIRTFTSGQNQGDSIFVRKGMKFKGTTGYFGNGISFKPLESEA